MFMERSATGGTSVEVRAGGNSSTIAYDGQSQTYLVTESEGPTLTFTPDQIVAEKSNATFTVYRDPASGIEFRQLNKRADNPLIALTYVSYGTWSQPYQPSEGYIEANKQTYVVYGAPTDAAAMPRSGGATYSAVLDGLYSARAGVFALSGNASFAADFGTGRIGYTMQAVATLGSSVVNMGAISGTGSISGATFFASNGYSGPYLSRVGGNFYGPTAQEIGGVFTLNGLPGATLSGGGGGVFVGKQN